MFRPLQHIIIEDDGAKIWENRESMSEPITDQLQRENIRELVWGLDPPDWIQIRLIARLSPGAQIMAGMRAAEFARALVRGALAERFPNASRSELNMRVLKHFTIVRMNSQ